MPSPRLPLLASPLIPALVMATAALAAAPAPLWSAPAATRHVPGTNRPLPAGFEALGTPCPPGTPRTLPARPGFGRHLVCGRGGRVAAVFQGPYRLQLAHFPSFVHQTPLVGRRRSGRWVGVVGATVWIRDITCGACRRIMGWTAIAEVARLDPTTRAALQQRAGLPASPVLRRAAAWRQAFRPKHGGAPTRFEIYAALLASAQLPLSTGRHCKGVVGAPLKRPPTLGDWIAYNLSVLEGGRVTLPAACRPAPGATRGRLWDCQVDFSVVNPKTQLFWTWGVRFQLRDHQRRLDPRSLMCTGSG